MKYILMLLVFVSNFCYSANYRTKIQLEDNGGVGIPPQLSLPFDWENGFSSMLGYSSYSERKEQTVNGFAESKNAVLASGWELKINWLTYELSNFSVGLVTNYSNTNRTEFGYIHDSEQLFGQGGDYYISFDNEVDIERLQTGINLVYHLRLSNFDIHNAIEVTPQNSLSVKQNTLFKPLVNELGESRVKTSQSVAYNYALSAFYTGLPYIDLGVEFEHQFQPLKYQFVQLAINDQDFVFQESTVDTEEITNQYMFKLALKRTVLGELSPTIGFGSRSIKTKDLVESKSVTNSDNIVTFGLESTF
jgi:hypothetical protein